MCLFTYLFLLKTTTFDELINEPISNKCSLISKMDINQVICLRTVHCVDLRVSN